LYTSIELLLPSIISTLQTRSARGLTIDFGKTKAHKNSMGNDQADHLANTLAGGLLNVVCTVR
jgi:hypothetical protein